ATISTPPTTSQARGLSILTLPARIGLLRLFAGPLGLTSGLSPEVQEAYTAFSVTPRYIQAYLVDEGAGMPQSFMQAGARTEFCGLPVIVLSRGLDPDQDWQAMQTGLLHLSSPNPQKVSYKNGHHIQPEPPKASLAAIL